MRATVACFGELLLRLSPPDGLRLSQTGALDVNVGGAEANVAVSLAQFGHDVRMASVVPDSPLADRAVGELRRHGVDVSRVHRAAGRIGLYFLEPGAVVRPSRIVYDRAGSAFALADPASFDWAALLDGAGWLHLSGVTPAVGAASSRAACDAVRAARDAGVHVSFDGNYRALLWKAWSGDGASILREILSCTRIAFINERDISLVLGKVFADRAGAFEAAFAAFPALEMVAATTRQHASVGDQAITGELVTRDGRWMSATHTLDSVVDRIGTGDAFAAGVLHGVIQGRDPQYCIDFGAAAGALKHAVRGDFNLVSIAEVEELLAGGSLDVRR